MNRLSHFLLLGTFTIATLRVRGQEPYQIARVIPPSPTASSLGAYGDYEVGYYNGRPDIDIPLYSVKANDLSLDLSLSYDASGTKVSQDASWIGLGWSLMAGGCITHTIRGLDDLLPGPVYNGYYNGVHLPPNTSENQYDPSSPTSADDLNFFEGVSSGGQDGEPDIFNYNFAGLSGKMVLGKKQDGGISFVSNRNNLKIQYAGNAWVITDANGNMYYFGTLENADNYYYSNLGAQVADDAPLSSFNLDPNTYRSVLAWYLDSIVSPTHEVISFVYTTGQSLSIIGESEQSYNVLSEDGGCEGSNSSSPNLPGSLIQYSADRQLIYDVVLQKIVFRSGSIVFGTSNRDDVESPSTSYIPQKLSTIKVEDNNGNVIKQENFYYTYFNGDIGAVYSRLKLDSLVEIGGDGQRKPPYAFTYFNPNNLPSKYNKGVDKWGYYNGQDGNTTLLPAMTNTLITNIYLDGGIRDADTLNLYPRDGVLSTISYPTGGSTSFDYELNEYGNLDPPDQSISQPENVYVTAGMLGQNDLSDQQVSFDLTAPTSVTIFYNWSDNCMPTCQTNGLEGYPYATLLLNGQGYAQWSNNPGDDEDQVTLMLNPGHYTLVSSYVQYFTTTVGAYWVNQIPVYYKKGAGIRIKQIQNFDGFGNSKIRKFNYVVPAYGGTSGRLIQKVLYYYYFSDAETSEGVNQGAEWECSFTGQYIGRMSNSLYPIGFSDGGGNVGYDVVTEVDGANGENGSTEHDFYNNDVVLDQSALPSIPLSVDPLNGKELVSQVFDASGNLLSRTFKTYGINESLTLKGLKLFTGPWASPNNFTIQYYDNPSTWAVPQTERDVVYSGGDSLVTTKTFYFTNTDNKELTRSTTVKSDGRTLISKYKRADDYAGAGSSSFAAQMVAAHMISPVIEQQTLLQSASSTGLVAGQFTAYNQFNGFLKPATVYRISQTAVNSDTTESSISSSGQVSMHSAYEPEVYFDQYDGTGNINQLHKINAMDQSYFWDYKNAYPTAEVKNAALQDVAYTSFEADGSGGWIIGSALRDTGGITGSSCYNLSNGAVTKSGLNASTVYVVSYWIRGNQPLSIGSGGPLQGKTIGAFTYFEHYVYGVTSVTVSGSGDIDELRLYPQVAQMTTYTYNPLVGITSACDVGNRVTYYHYDTLGRLLYVQEQDGNITRTFGYHYQGR